MDLPIEVIEAVKDTQAELDTGKARKKYVKESTKRILHAIGNGLRTSASIANALNLNKQRVQTNLWTLKERGFIHGAKKTGSTEYKYWLTTDKPTLETLDLTPKKKARKPYTKRAVKPAAVKPTLTREEREVSSKYSLAYIQQLEKDVVFKTERISQLELSLVEKEKEVWTLECEVFDKKAIIAYLESKQFGGK